MISSIVPFGETARKVVCEFPIVTGNFQTTPVLSPLVDDDAISISLLKSLIEGALEYIVRMNGSPDGRYFSRRDVI